MYTIGTWGWTVAKLHMVVGPPAGGKSTYVDTNAPAGTPRFDFDKVAALVGGVESFDSTPSAVAEVVLAMRRGLLGWLLDPETVQDTDVWVVNTNPSENTIIKWVQAGGVFHVVDPGESEALARATRQGRGEDTLSAIRAWYSAPPQIPKDNRVKEGTRGMKLKNMAVKVKEATEDNDSSVGHIKAYASVFDNVDRHGDVLRKGAFAETIEAWQKSGNNIPLLYGHDFSDPFANIGTVKSVVEDDHGLLIEATLDLDNAKAKQVHRLLKEKRLTQMSYAFDVLEAAPATVDGDEVYEITKAHLHEVSVVPIGANSATEVLAVKAAGDDVVTRSEFESWVERVKALEADTPDEEDTDENNDSNDDEGAKSSQSDNHNRVNALKMAVDIMTLNF